MKLLDSLYNPVLIAGLVSWGVAQILKVPIEYIRSRRWNWSLLFLAGGMPSSHASLMIGVTHALGLFVGFDSPIYALSVALALVVVYDATGIRRQAGKHAELINAMIADLTSGHPLKEEQLREVLGHTPLEALGGVILGLVVAQATWALWG